MKKAIYRQDLGNFMECTIVELGRGEVSVGSFKGTEMKYKDELLEVSSPMLTFDLNKEALPIGTDSDKIDVAVRNPQVRVLIEIKNLESLQVLKEAISKIETELFRRENV